MTRHRRTTFPGRPQASRRSCLALPVLLATSGIASAQQRLSPDSSIGDLLRHPAFAGFARRMLPWDERAYDEQMLLSAIGSLLPYHSHVDPRSTVQALNRMIDDAATGQTIFFDIYDDAEKRRDPAKAHTGLFFLRGRAGAPFSIVAPGGGFSYVGSLHEGFPYAAAISAAGFNGFVVKYRTGQGGGPPTQDLAAAIRFVFANAAALGVDTRGYALWGSSAGARMAAAIGSHGVARFGGPDLPKPSTVVMAYTAHSDVAASEPPTFVVVGAQDSISPPESMRRRVSELRRVATDVAYREYPNVGHGFGLGIGTSAEGWVDEAIRFWARHQPR